MDKSNPKWRRPVEGDVDSNNHLSGKNYAAGVLPCCVNEHGEGMFLLGLEGRRALVHGAIELFTSRDTSEMIGWCHFQGWQDKGDVNEEHTAAREASEEGLDVFGSEHFLMECLHDRNACDALFQGCYVIYLGVLCQEERNAMEERFARSKKTRKPRARRSNELVYGVVYPD